MAAETTAVQRYAAATRGAQGDRVKGFAVPERTATQEVNGCCEGACLTFHRAVTDSHIQDAFNLFFRPHVMSFSSSDPAVGPPQLHFTQRTTYLTCITTEMTITKLYGSKEVVTVRHPVTRWVVSVAIGEIAIRILGLP